MCDSTVCALQIEELKSVCDTAVARPLNWQTFCKDNDGVCVCVCVVVSIEVKNRPLS